MASADVLAAAVGWRARYDLTDMVTSAWAVWQSCRSPHRDGVPVLNRSTVS